MVRKPATKEREGINPFTGEKTIFKAKPARNVVKALPLKNLKKMVEVPPVIPTRGHAAYRNAHDAAFPLVGRVTSRGVPWKSQQLLGAG